MNKLLIAVSITGISLFALSPAHADSAKGQGIYMNFCASCHDSGIAGAPKTGDKAAWKPRIAKGVDVLTANAIKGFKGSSGFMPAKGGMSALSDEEVTNAVMFMLEQVR